MKNRWNEKDAKQFLKDPLGLRVYSSRLLGEESNLVLHGGGNTSVKAKVKNIFGENIDVLYVKGSGWDLATIEARGFAPVRMDALLRMAKLEHLSDTEMVKAQRVAMLDPYAPNPSVEAILHAIIPFKFVDHTHADSVVAITNTKDGERRIKDIYGNRFMIIPYVMPGFILAKKVYEITQNVDWKKLDGMILLNHGIFTFSDDAKISYEKMIKAVSKAEQYLRKHHRVSVKISKDQKLDLSYIANLRRIVSKVRGEAVLAVFDDRKEVKRFVSHPKIASIATRGLLTPDHVIRMKRIPVVINQNVEQDIDLFVQNYQKYFQRFADGTMQQLDSAPRWAILPKQGVVYLGRNVQENKIIADIALHTMSSILSAEYLGGWKPLSERHIFDVEYWDLEQAKLKTAGKSLPFDGKIALVTGAASGIGRACVEMLSSQGASVVGLDIDFKVKTLFFKRNILGVICDITNEKNIQKAVTTTVHRFGGIDLLVSNAGVFPLSETIAQLNPKVWQRSLDINLTSHQRLIKECVPYLSKGIDSNIVIIGSKNVPAPGPGAGAYSVAKAGLTQLARVAALELASSGIRVNVIHPNQVFDTAIWTKEVLTKRAAHYKMSIDEYKRSNLLRTEITSKDVANLVFAVASGAFSKTTGAQIPIDGGNDRVV